MAISNLTTMDIPFFSCNPKLDLLFTVREGVPIEDALNTASCLLDVARASAYSADEEPALIHSAGFHIEAAKAIVDSIISGIIRERNMGKASEVNHG